MKRREEVDLKKGLGLISTTAIVTGNVMGSGIFLLVASLSQECSPGSAMLGWIISGLGAIFMGLSFANLGAKIPKTGGPYEYVKEAFGNFMGFTNAWLFWNSYWIAIIASLVSATAYVAAFIPFLNENRLGAFLFTSAVLWVFTYINIKGIEEAAIFQTILTTAVIILSKLSCLPIYACTSLADIKLWKKENKNCTFLQLLKYSLIPMLGFIYAAWAIYGSGLESVIYCLVLMGAGVPLYFYQRRKNISVMRNEDMYIDLVE